MFYKGECRSARGDPGTSHRQAYLQISRSCTHKWPGEQRHRAFVRQDVLRTWVVIWIWITPWTNWTKKLFLRTKTIIVYRYVFLKPNLAYYYLRNITFWAYAAGCLEDRVCGCAEGPLWYSREVFGGYMEMLWAGFWWVSIPIRTSPCDYVLATGCLVCCMSFTCVTLFLAASDNSPCRLPVASIIL